MPPSPTPPLLASFGAKVFSQENFISSQSHKCTLGHSKRGWIHKEKSVGVQKGINKVPRYLRVHTGLRCYQLCLLCTVYKWGNVKNQSCTSWHAKSLKITNFVQRISELRLHNFRGPKIWNNFGNLVHSFIIRVDLKKRRPWIWWKMAIAWKMKIEYGPQIEFFFREV